MTDIQVTHWPLSLQVFSQLLETSLFADSNGGASAVPSHDHLPQGQAQDYGHQRQSQHLSYDSNPVPTSQEDTHVHSRQRSERVRDSPTQYTETVPQISLTLPPAAFKAPYGRRSRTKRHASGRDEYGYGYDSSSDRDIGPSGDETRSGGVSEGAYYY